MAGAGRGKTRRDAKRRVLRPGESIRADGNWSLRTGFLPAKSRASPSGNWRNRSIPIWTG